MEEQLGGRSSGESDRNHQQQRRMKMPENISSSPAQPPQPPLQKCPRCDSNNTKFCYYNNYSLTQPRYFCKTCRRYWTQGGTLRNIPVGGGCRKGKRTMKGGGISGGSSSSAGEISSRSHHHQVLQPPQIANSSAAAAAFFSSNNSRSQPLALPSMSSLYTGGVGGGGFLSSLAAMQSMTTQLSQGINNQSQLGVISASNNNNNQFGNFNIPTSTPKVQINQQMESTGFYQMVNTEKPNMESSFYPSDQTLQFQPTRPLSSWTQRFINNNNNNIWPNSSASNSSSGGANSSTTAAGASLSPNDQWPDLPGFGPSP